MREDGQDSVCMMQVGKKYTCSGPENIVEHDAGMTSHHTSFLYS